MPLPLLLPLPVAALPLPLSDALAPPVVAATTAAAADVPVAAAAAMLPADDALPATPLEPAWPYAFALPTPDLPSLQIVSLVLCREAFLTRPGGTEPCARPLVALWTFRWTSPSAVDRRMTFRWAGT